MRDFIKTALKKLQCSSLILPLLGLAFGLLTLFRPNTVSEGLCRLLGAGLLIAAISCLISWFTADTSRFWRGLALFGAIVLGIAALWLLLRPTAALRLVYAMLGISLIADGVSNLQLSSLLFGGAARRACTVFSILIVVLGVGALLNPLAAGAGITRLAGAVLIVSSLFGLYLLFRFYKKSQSDPSQER